MKLKNLIIATAFLFGAANVAQAEDGSSYYGYGQQNYGQTDSSYQIPQYYQGQYYPEEYNNSTGYYGAQRNAQNNASNDIRHSPEASYQNYYY